VAVVSNKNQSMSLSSNSIIHFTNTKDALKGILTENFKLFYCKEEILLDNKPLSFAVPMVSFCDIPISQVKNHITKYGAYGLGLTKSWAERQKLNPVLYVEKDSNLSRSYRNVYFEYVVNSGKDLTTLDDKENCIVDILRYIKNYQNDLVRGGQVYNDYRFSDEREWRYVLNFSEKPQMIYALEHFIKDEHNLELDKYKLEFEPNDIKYVIIQSESEIPEFLDLFRTTKGKNYSYSDVERLMTRIITTEQIVEDF